MISFKMSHVLHVFAVILIMAHIGESLNCWECNSALQDGCVDIPANVKNRDDVPQEIRKFYVNCNEKNDSFSDKYKLCRKQVQSIDGKERIIRGCGFEKGNKDCYNTANPPVKTYVCQCFTDGCNHSAQIVLNNILMVLSVSILTVCAISKYSYINN